MTLLGGLLSVSLFFLEGVLGRAVASSLKLANAVLDLELVNGELEYVEVTGG